MLEIYFVMSLLVERGQLPPFREKVESVEICQKKVAEATADFAKNEGNENYVFIAGCQVVAKKATPA